MPPIAEFTRPLGWKLKQGDPKETYPDGHVLIITRNTAPSIAPFVDLAWTDSVMVLRRLQGVPFDEGNGSIYGPTSDKSFTVKVELINGQLQGKVDRLIGIAPEAGTWGADANGGWEEKP